MGSYIIAYFACARRNVVKHPRRLQFLNIFHQESVFGSGKRVRQNAFSCSGSNSCCLSKVERQAGMRDSTIHNQRAPSMTAHKILM